MSHVIVLALLTAGTAVVAACALATLVVRDRYVRLHVLTPASVLGAPLVVAALAVDTGANRAMLKLVLIGLLLAGSAPVLTAATARALAVREGRVGTEEPE